MPPGDGRRAASLRLPVRRVRRALCERCSELLEATGIAYRVDTPPGPGARLLHQDGLRDRDGRAGRPRNPGGGRALRRARRGDGRPPTPGRRASAPGWSGRSSPCEAGRGRGRERSRTARRLSWSRLGEADAARRRRSRWRLRRGGIAAPIDYRDRARQGALDAGADEGGRQSRERGLAVIVGRRRARPRATVALKRMATERSGKCLWEALARVGPGATGRWREARMTGGSPVVMAEAMKTHALRCAAGERRRAQRSSWPDGCSAGGITAD